MRVTLVHNSAAGESSHSGQQLAALVRAAGHQVSLRSSEESGLEDALLTPADLLLVAGGDGTVAKVARKVVPRDVLMAIIPLGTSNNIASALGIDLSATPEAHIAALATASKRKLDVGVARAPWGTKLFLESAGVGCFAALLREPPPEHDAPKSEHIVRGAVQLRRLVERAPVRRRLVVADEVDLSGDYLLVAALNTPRIGSQVELAPDADPGDGLLDLVLIRETDRQTLIEYLRCLEAGRPARMPSVARRIQRVRLEWDHTEGHLDDQLWPDEPASGSGDIPDREPTIVELELAASTLQVALPAAGLQASPR